MDELRFVTKPNINLIAKIHMANMYKSMKAQIVQAVEAEFENEIMQGCTHTNELLKSAIIDVEEYPLTKVLWARCCGGFEVRQLNGIFSPGLRFRNIIRWALANQPLITPTEEVLCSFSDKWVDKGHRLIANRDSTHWRHHKPVMQECYHSVVRYQSQHLKMKEVKRDATVHCPISVFARSSRGEWQSPSR